MACNTFHSHSSFTLINIFGTGVILTVTNILPQAHLETKKEKLGVDSLSLGNEFKVHNYVNVEKNEMTSMRWFKTTSDGIIM